MELWIVSLVGSAAAFVGGLSGAAISSWTARLTHRERLKAEESLAERRYASDLALAEKKLTLDRTLADWKRRTELAEQILSDFYKAQSIFDAARQPFSFGGEGSTRPRREQDDPSEIDHKDAVYAPFERLTKERDFLSDLHARRFRFMALFGTEFAQPFTALVQSYNQISTATGALLNDRRHLSDEQRREFETMIGWGLSSGDPIKDAISAAISQIEAVCRPILQTNPE